MQLSPSLLEQGIYAEEICNHKGIQKHKIYKHNGIYKHKRYYKHKAI